MISFNEYYTKFLGIDKEKFNKGKNVFISEYRDQPLNKQYYYPFIISDYYGILICSVSNEYFDIAEAYFDGTEESINTIVETLKQIDKSFRVRKMHRFSYNIDEESTLTNNELDINLCSVRQISNNSTLYSNEDAQNHSLEQLKAKPLTHELIKNIKLSGISIEDYIKRNKEKLDSKREYVVVKNDKIASRAFISEIYEGGGNIVVFTNEEHRNNGYGKDVVKGCLGWCFNENILPIYLVEDGNKPSLNIPISLNFKKQAIEFIISK